MIAGLIDWLGLFIFALLFFLLGVFLTYNIMREKMKTRAYIEAKREAWRIFTELFEEERRRVEKEISNEFKVKFEEWKRDFINKLKSNFPNLDLSGIVNNDEYEESK